MAHRTIRAARSTSRVLASGKPVVRVFKSNKHLLAQLCDAQTQQTVFTVTTQNQTGTKTEKATAMAALFARKLAEKQISNVVFHRNGFLYHGRVKAFADGLRTHNITL
jgi:large subunit ribosomal protein L18